MIPRCFVDPEHWALPSFFLSFRDSRHVHEVLRCSTGDRVVVYDGRGGEALCRITGEGNDGCLAVEVQERGNQPGDKVLLTLIQAIPKDQKMDWIIQKATELGVREILPVMTERGIVRLAGDRADHRAERWQRVAVEAARQCRTAWAPRVGGIVPLPGILDRGIGVDLLLIASLEAEARSIKGFLHTIIGARPRSIGLMIGPEGDFSPDEYALAKAKGAIPVRYGSRVLRVETAAIYGLSVLQYELEDPDVANG